MNHVGRKTVGTAQFSNAVERPESEVVTITEQRFRHSVILKTLQPFGKSKARKEGPRELRLAREPVEALARQDFTLHELGICLTQSYGCHAVLQSFRALRHNYPNVMIGITSIKTVLGIFQ